MARKLITIAILLLIYDRLEYAWYVVEGMNVYYKVPYVFTGNAIRIDSWVYLASVKVQHIVTIYILHILLPMREYTKWILVAFALALIELHLTYNEPFMRIFLPVIGNWQPYIPVSTATLKLASVCYFIFGCIQNALKSD